MPYTCLIASTEKMMKNIEMKEKIPRPIKFVVESKPKYLWVRKCIKVLFWPTLQNIIWYYPTYLHFPWAFCCKTLQSFTLEILHNSEKIPENWKSRESKIKFSVYCNICTSFNFKICRKQKKAIKCHFLKFFNCAKTPKVEFDKKVLN